MRARRTIHWCLSLTIFTAAACGNGATSSNDLGNGAADLGGSAIDLAGADLTAAPGDMTVRPPVPDGMVQLSGAAAKGPLVIGSSVDVSPTDSTGNPSGTVYQTQTSDNAGEFSLNVPPVGLAQLKASGYYYNEIAGTVSASTLELSALTDLTTTATQSAFINLVTHLTFLRVKTLLAQGMALDQSTSQAETELRGQLQVGGNFNPNAAGTQMSFLAGDTDPAAYLFSMAAVFVRSAMIKGGGSVEGVLQSNLNTVQSDLAANGQIDATMLGYLARAQKCVRPSEAMTKLATYFTSIGSTATVPDINRALDSDGDGVPNLSDTCLRVANPTQAAVTDQICSSSIDTSPTATIDTTGATLSGGSLRKVDLDNDGKPDLVAVYTIQNFTARTSVPVAAVWMNPGTTLGAPLIVDLSSQLGTAVQLYQARGADLNGDGKGDLAISYSTVNTTTFQASPPKLVYLPGDGAGGFGAPVTLAAGVDPYLCGGTYCNSMQACSGNTCVALCNGGVCGANQSCGMMTNSCVDNCGTTGAPCGFGSTCVSGICQSNCGGSPPCATGYTCVGSGGMAACEQTCGATSCAPGSTCVSGTCEPQCGATTCSGATPICDYFTTTCVATCGMGSCPAGFFCVKDGCMPGCGNNPPCPSGEGCGFNSSTGGQSCQPLCGAMTCNSNQSCVASMCEQNCGAAPCPTGETCGSSPTGQFCGTPCGSPTNPPCSPGQVCMSGSCVTPSCGGATCFPGQSCVGGTTCVGNCGSGGPCSGGQLCVYGACQAAQFPGIADFSLADVDGDGMVDVVGTLYPPPSDPNGMFRGSLPADRTAGIAVIRQTAAGVWGTPSTTAITSTTNTDALDLLAADFNGDTKPELVVSFRGNVNTMGGANMETYAIVYLANDGAGNFTAGSPTQLGMIRPGFSSGNFDGNSQRDLAVVLPNQGGPGMTTSSMVSVLYDFSGAVGTPATLNISADATSAYADCTDAIPPALTTNDYGGQLSIGDLNGDGKDDLFVGQWVYLSKGASFGAPGRIEGVGIGVAGLGSFSTGNSGGIELPRPSGPLMLDLAGDGKFEAVALSAKTSSGPSGNGPTALGLEVGRVNPAGVHTW